MREQLTGAGFNLDEMPAQILRDYVPQSLHDLKVHYDVQRDAAGRPKLMVQAQFATKQGSFVVQQSLEDAVKGNKKYEFRSMFGHIDGPAHRDGRGRPGLIGGRAAPPG